MPRVTLSLEQKKEYKMKDLKKWVKMQIAANGLNQTKVGEALGISQVALSQRLKNNVVGGKVMNPDPFSYGDIVTLCNLFGVSDEEKIRLLTL